MPIKLLYIYLIRFMSQCSVHAQLGHLNHGGGQLKVAAAAASVRRC